MSPSAHHHRPRAPRCRGDAGFFGGSESFIFGALVFVGAMLILVNAWAVIDAKMGTSSAARETARTYVEGDGSTGPAVQAGRDAFSGAGAFNEGDLSISIAGTFERCQRITVTSQYTVPALSVPFVGGFGGGITVTSTHSEIVDPFRSGLEGMAICG